MRDQTIYLILMVCEIATTAKWLKNEGNLAGHIINSRPELNYGILRIMKGVLVGGHTRESLYRTGPKFELRCAIVKKPHGC